MDVSQLRICQGAECHWHTLIGYINDLEPSRAGKTEYHFTRIMTRCTLIGTRIREYMGIGVVRVGSGPEPDFGQAGGIGKADES